MKAYWHNVLIAEAAQTVQVDGNHYFPATALKMAHLRASTKQTICGWKGTATYYDVVVGDQVNQDAAWTYAAPEEAAKEIEGHVAFWRGVEIRP